MRHCAILALILSVFIQNSYGQSSTIGGCPVFPPDNIWNTPIDSLPVHANSSVYIRSIGPASYTHPDFNSGLWRGGPIGIPYVAVTGSQTRYPVSFHYYSESDPGPYPIPLNAPIQEGPNSTGDRHVIAVDTTNCKIYEMYKAYPGPSSWTAGSGAIFDMRSNALRPALWTSANAAGLSMLAGLVRYDEVAAGEIRHAIAFTVPQTRREFVWPARHYASWSTDSRLPAMGQRFRLKANVDISSFPAEVQVILRALKKYGMMITDNGAPWFLMGVPDSRWNSSNLLTIRRILGESFEAVDVSSLMIDPNSGQARQLQPSVSVSPASSTLQTQATRQFTANQAVTWMVNGVAAGNSMVGYINSTGLYSAPSSVPVPATVQIQAKSVANPSVVGSASVTITASNSAPTPPVQTCTYQISPKMVTIGAAGGTANVTVTASSPTCRWNAGTGFDWGLSLIGYPTRTGSSVLQYSFAPNTGRTRGGYVPMAGTSIQFMQWDR